MIRMTLMLVASARPKIAVYMTWLVASSACHRPSTSDPPAVRVPMRAVALPGGARGIGFDDLRFAPEIHRVVAPAGGTGKLDLVDPKSGEVTAIGGFSATERGARGHEDGTTSADEGGGMLYAIDRTARRLDV